MGSKLYNWESLIVVTSFQPFVVSSLPSRSCSQLLPSSLPDRNPDYVLDPFPDVFSTRSPIVCRPVPPSNRVIPSHPVPQVTSDARVPYLSLNKTETFSYSVPWEDLQPKSDCGGRDGPKMCRALPSAPRPGSYTLAKSADSWKYFFVGFCRLEFLKFGSGVFNSARIHENGFPRKTTLVCACISHRTFQFPA